MSHLIAIIVGAVFLMLGWSWIFTKNPRPKSANHIEKAFSPADRGELIVTIYPDGRTETKFKSDSQTRVSGEEIVEVVIPVKRWKAV